MLVHGVGHAATPLSFEESVRPLLQAHCFACHGDDELGGKLDVRLVRSLQRGGDSGPAVVAGQREKSPLYLKLKAGEMPPDGKRGLNADEIELIGRWIDAGAVTKRPEPEQFTEDLLLLEARDFWSFRPLPPIAAMPVTEDLRGWSSGPIDTFVLQGLQRAGLTPSARASGRVLQRRLYFAP